MQVAQRTGELIRHGRQGLFRDLRATIDFDLANYDSRKNAGGSKLTKLAMNSRPNY